MSSGTAPGRPQRLAGLCAVLGLAVAACGSEPPELRVVAARLGPEDFGRTLPARRGPVEKIAGEARPVVAAPAEREIGRWLGLPISGGRVRIDVPWPASAGPPSEAPLVLHVQGVPCLPGETERCEERAREQARSGAWRTLRSGWRLRSGSAAAKQTLQIDASDRSWWGVVREGLERRLNVRLAELERSPARLRSRAFSAPPEGRLVLGYGLLPVRAPAAARPVRFRATLACDERPERQVLSASVSESPAAWRGAHVDLPRSAGRCRIGLEATGPDGDGVPGAVWSVPRLRARAGGPAAERAPNLVLISLDTLRADHLSGYGYARETSPAIDARLIERGTAFTDVTATYTMTDVSHLSLLAGLYPAAQPRPGRVGPDDDVRLLAEVVGDAGFETVAFTEDALLAGSYGFWYGFDRFVERPFSESERGRETVRDAIGLLREARGRRLFLFVHTYKTHGPYVSNEPYSSMWRDAPEPPVAPRVPEAHRHLLDAYDRTIREADSFVADLLDALAALELDRRTLVALVSDHGEAFGEHGPLGHGMGPPHQEQLRVPLILRGPGVPAGLRVREPVSLADVTPTLLDLLGLEAPPRAQGRSLAAALRDGALPPDRPLYFAWPAEGGEGVRIGRWKLWQRSGRSVLHDLEADPHETAPRKDEQIASRARALLQSHTEDSRRLRLEVAGDRLEAPEIDQDVQRTLRALGYVEP